MAACAAQVDAQVRAVQGRVLAQRRSAEVAFAYVAALSPWTRANCWALAEAAGHEGQGRMQALAGSYVWDWGDLRAELAGLAGAWLPDREGDLIGPGSRSGRTGYVRAVAFSPDGRLLASGGFDDTVRLWDLATGRPWPSLSGHTKAGQLCDVQPGRTAAGQLQHRYPDTATAHDVARRPPGHSVGKQCRENYVA